MGIFGPDVAEWEALKNALHLDRYETTTPFKAGMTFRQMRSALGVPGSAAPSFAHWLYGVVDGIETIVLTYDVGSGSSAVTYTAAIARVDPPLFLGLGIRREGLFEQWFGTDDIVLNEPEIDRALHIMGDAARVRVLLSPSNPESRPLVEHLVRLACDELQVTDSYVLVGRTGVVTTPAVVHGFAENARLVARELVARRARLPATPQEAAVIAEWERFADANGFQLDVPRMKLAGAVGGARVEVALETQGTVLSTIVAVRFPREVRLAFAAYRTDTPSIFQGLFSQDIKIGDRAFDDAFVVTGQPEQAIRELLSRPKLLEVLKEIGSHTSELQMNHRGLYARLGPLGSEPQLRHLVDRVRTASDALFDEAVRIGPYR